MILDGLEKYLLLDRLGQIRGAASGQAGLAVALEGGSCKGDDRGGRTAVFDLPSADRSSSGEAVHNGHLAIHEHQVVAAFLEHLAGPQTRLGHVDPVGGVLEIGERDNAVVRGVFGHQDA